MRIAFYKSDRDYLTKRVYQETRAALRCQDPRAAAAHVELANRYLAQLNETSR